MKKLLITAAIGGAFVGGFYSGFESFRYLATKKLDKVIPLYSKFLANLITDYNDKNLTQEEVEARIANDMSFMEIVARN